MALPALHRDAIRLLWVGSPDPAAAASLLPADSGLAVEHCLASNLLERLERNPPHVLLVELANVQPALLTQLGEDWPELGVVVLAENNDASELTAASELSAEWIARGDSPTALRPAIERALKRARHVEQRPPELPWREHADDGLVGASPAMDGVRELIARVAPTSATVLVRGETGTGKELVARAVHRLSRCAAGPFVALHVAALPDELLESELFGYEKGAFTGAHRRKPGRVELAAGGTLFLDEIAEISSRMQAKLLRLLQEREFMRLGGESSLRTDARVIAATHRDLEQMVAAGEFREDLFYRLNVMTLRLPPLRARRDDIARLASHFLAQFAVSHGRPGLAFEPAALEALRAERWPGNVRQLLNFVERLSVLASGDTIRAGDVATELSGGRAFSTESTAQLRSHLEPVVGAETLAPVSSVRPLRDDVQRAERTALLKALAHTQGNRTLAARLLGVGRRTLYSKLEEHGLLEK